MRYINFIVLSKKTIIVSILTISVLMATCFVGSYLVNKTIETATSDRLLPIYSVETSEKKVALTFDCAWSWLQ